MEHQVKIKKVLSINSLEKRQNQTYPEWLKQSYDYTSFTDGPEGFSIGGLRIGTLELKGLKTYPAHSHEASEIYVVLQGAADWYIDDENYQVKEGDVLYHPSGASHGWRNLSILALKLLWVWWDESVSSEQLNGVAALCNGFSLSDKNTLPYKKNLSKIFEKVKECEKKA